MKRKVLFVANDFATLYNFRLELIQNLIAEGYQVFIAVPADDRNRIFSEMGCSVHTIRLSRFGKNPFADLRTTADIIKVCRKTHPDIVFTYTAKGNIYGGIAAYLSRIPYVCNVTGLSSQLGKKSVVNAIMEILQRISFRPAKVVFCQNESNRDYLISRKILGNNHALIPGSGVNLSSNPYEEYPDNAVLRFLTVARIGEDKGYNELFEAIKQLRAKGSNAEFHIVGETEDTSYDGIVREMREKYDVIFHGGISHEEVHQILKTCDCLIHPSYHEGMANVILEAAACGRPVIASDIPGCREAVDEGVSGFCVPVKDAAALAGAIMRVAEMPAAQRMEMGKRGRKKMEEAFDRNFVIAAYKREIDRVMLAKKK